VAITNPLSGALDFFEPRARFGGILSTAGGVVFTGGAESSALFTFALP
jgi:hypothetical protein